MRASELLIPPKPMQRQLLDARREQIHVCMQPYCVRPPVRGLLGGIIPSALPAIIVRERWARWNSLPI